MTARFRSGALAACSAALAVAAHGMAGGDAPESAITVTCAVLFAWAGTALARNRDSAMATLAVLAFTQLSEHLMLTQLAADHRHAELAAQINGNAMLAAHVLATLTTALLLTRADALLDIVASTVRAVVAAIVTILPAPEPALVPVAVATPRRLVDLHLRRVQPRRGPPVFS